MRSSDHLSATLETFVIDLMGRCPEGIIWFLEFWLVVSPVGPDYWWTSDNKLIEID